MFGRELSPGATFAQGLVVKKTLHVGTHSVVYEVTQASTGASRALKVIHGEFGKDPKYAEAFLARARAAARIKSEHVAAVLDCGTFEDQPYCVMELLSGHSLEQELMRTETLPVAAGTQLLMELGHALAAAHDVGVTHGDLKPEGIILAQTERPDRFRTEVQFVGAGLVASLCFDNTTAAMSRPLWMAPEQADAGAHLDPRMDVWSYGLLAFYVMTGRHYFKTARDTGSAQMTLMREVLYEPLIAPSIRAEELGVIGRLPAGFDTWFARCVSRERDGRFAHAREAADALAVLIGAARPSVPAPTAGVSPTGPTELAGGSPATTATSAATQAPAPVEKRGAVGVVLAVIAALLLLTAGAGYGAKRYFDGKEREEKAAEAARKEAEEQKRAEEEAERKKRETWSDEEALVPISSKDAHFGARAAPVTIVVFTDLECPFCKKLEDTLDTIAIKRGEAQLRIVYKHNPLPFHKQALPAAEIGMQVFAKKGFVGFAKYKSRVFAMKQPSVEDLEEIAKDVGLKRKDLDDADLRALGKATVEKDMALAKKLGARGTPTMFINGIRMTGAQAREKIDEVIDAEASAAKSLLEKGTAPDKVYVERTKENYTEAEERPSKPASDDMAVWKVPVGDAPTAGPADALVTIVVFSDFQCPFCARVTSTLSDLQREYKGRLRLVWKDHPLPFHKQALPAAKLAREVRAQKGDASFWKAHDLLFENIKALADEDLVKYGTQLGLTAASARAALASPKHQKGIDLDMALAEEVEVRGTPHFFINGVRLKGAASIDKFRERIDAAEVEARAEQQRMASRGDTGPVYEQLIKNGKTTGLELKEPGPIPLSSPRIGAKSPKIVVQWFSDLECPFCKKLHPTLMQMMDDYEEDVSLVYRHLPLPMHTRARAAAIAAEEVRFQLGDRAFFDYVDKVLRGTPSLDLSDSGLVAAAPRAAQGKTLSVPKLTAAITSGAHAARIDADLEEAKRLGIGATPSLLVGKYYLSGAVSYDKLKRAVDRALKEAP